MIIHYGESSLKRRYYQAQDDISFAVMGLLPSLADKIQNGMDVEQIMAELQALTRPKSRTASPSTLPLQTESTVPSEFLLPRHPGQNHDDSRSEGDTESVASSSASHYDTASGCSSILDGSTSSWVDQLSSTASLVNVSSPPGVVSDLSDSITSATSLATSSYAVVSAETRFPYLF